MALTNSGSDPVVPTLAAFGLDIALRREALRIVVPRNNGLNRTDSKRALLAAITDTGGKW